MSSPAPTTAGVVTLDAVTLDAVTEAWITDREHAVGEPAWLTERRLTALKRYLDQAWPDSRADEFWRSTPFDRRVSVDGPIVASGAGREMSGAEGAEVDDGLAGPQAPTSLTASLEMTTALARVVDGRVVETTVPAELAERGVVVTDLATAATEHRELVEAHLGSLTTSNAEGTGANEDRTITVNDAAWTAGVFVHVPAEVELDAPIGVHVHATRAGAHLPRVLAVVDHHAKATIYLEHTSGAGREIERGVEDERADGPILVDEVVEVVAGDGARVDLASLQEWGQRVTHLSLQKVLAHRDATVRTIGVTVGGATVRLRPECDLVGPGASVRPLGVYFADEGQWFDLQPYVRHLAPHASSDVLFKGALQGKSRTVFRGNVYVHRDAVGTSTDETNRSLILTDKARADSTPFLEIECADITAGHGSATGQIDARHLFYLESRGIPRAEALRLIVDGFFRAVLAIVDLPGLEARALSHFEHEIASADLDAIAINDASLREGEDT